MKRMMQFAAVVTIAAGSAVSAQTLQMDVNAIGVQAHDALGAPSAFGGLNHTGSLSLSDVAGITYMAGVYIDSFSQGFNGTLTDFTADIDIVNGNVMGGMLSVTVNGTDVYTADIATAGFVSTFVGGGFTVQGLTINGMFSSANFANVNVSPWAGGGLPGSFLQFNFQPTATGGGFADMDLFVQVVPLPPAMWAGAGLMGGMMLIRRATRRA